MSLIRQNTGVLPGSILARILKALRNSKKMLKIIYIKTMLSLGRFLTVIKIIAFLEKFPDSRWAKYFISIFYIYDFKKMIELDLAWWNFKTMAKVDAFLRKRNDASVFEYGSGASTAWLAKRSALVASVEFDRSFYAQLAFVLEDKEGIDLMLREPTSGEGGFPSHKSGFEGLDFKDYVKEIENYDKFDLIIIDGRAREACLEYAVNHLKQDGMILFDNTLRDRYLKKIDEFPQFEIEHITGLVPSLPYPDRSTVMRFKEYP